MKVVSQFTSAAVSNSILPPDDVSKRFAAITNHLSVRQLGTCIIMPTSFSRLSQQVGIE